MRSTARFVCTTWLVAAVACSDDGLTVQDLNSSSTAGVDTGVGDSSGQAATTADSNNPPDDTGSSDGPGTTMGPADTGSETATDGGSDGPSTTGGIETGTGTGTTDGTGTTGEPCEPITDDPSAIGMECGNGIDCPEGYTCQPFEGFVFQETCQILCTMDCECPVGLSCLETGDKTGAVWFQCGPA